MLNCKYFQQHDKINENDEYKSYKKTIKTQIL